jgi:hypothetical protein
MPFETIVQQLYPFGAAIPVELLQRLLDAERLLQRLSPALHLDDPQVIALIVAQYQRESAVPVALPETGRETR